MELTRKENFAPPEIPHIDRDVSLIDDSYIEAITRRLIAKKHGFSTK